MFIKYKATNSPHDRTCSFFPIARLYHIEKFCAACILKARILFRTSTSNWPPSCTSRYNTAAQVQCCPSQNKLTIVLCIEETNSSGGSMTIVLCHKMEAARLFTTRTHPRYDNWGNSHRHFDNRAETFSAKPSQFFPLKLFIS